MWYTNPVLHHTWSSRQTPGPEQVLPSGQQVLLPEQYSPVSQ